MKIDPKEEFEWLEDLNHGHKMLAWTLIFVAAFWFLTLGSYVLCKAAQWLGVW